MKSIDNKLECSAAAVQAGKSSTTVKVNEDSHGDQKPTGCSWHDTSSDNLELWKSSNGDCNVNGYAGCFCKKIPGEKCNCSK